MSRIDAGARAQQAARRSENQRRHRPEHRSQSPDPNGRTVLSGRWQRIARKRPKPQTMPRIYARGVRSLLQACRKNGGVSSALPTSVEKNGKVSAPASVERSAIAPNPCGTCGSIQRTKPQINASTANIAPKIAPLRMPCANADVPRPRSAAVRRRLRSRRPCDIEEGPEAGLRERGADDRNRALF